MPVNSFKLDSSQFFLTYPQSRLELAAAFDYLINLELSGVKPIKVIVAEELHRDDQVHHHAYVRFPKKITIRDPHAFDIDGRHANVQGCRSPKAVIDYVTKGGQYKANFEVKLTRVAALSEMLHEASTPDEFLHKVVRLDVEWALSRFGVLRQFAEWKFRSGSKISPAIRPYSDFTAVPDVLARFRDLLDTNVPGERTMRSVWLSGATRLGKTQLARSLGDHGYMQGIWNMENITDEAKYFVFDDIDFDSVKYIHKQLFGLQTDINLTGKYRRPQTFKWGIPIIFITNTVPFLDYDIQEWMEGNVDFVHITHRLY